MRATPDQDALGAACDRAAWAGGVLTIDLDALAANYRTLRDRTAPSVCAAVVKADGYGLGAEPVTRRLAEEGCRHFFVAHLMEGIAVRRALTRESAVYILNGPMPGSGAEMAAHGLVPVLNSMAQIAEWGALSRHLGRPLAAALQVDTGMSRFGVSADEAARLAAEPALLDGIMPILLMSHLGCADEPAHPLNAEQRRRFLACRALLPWVAASLAASSGIFLGRDYHFDMVRPGAALYGVNPTPASANPLRPVVRLQGHIVQTRWIPPGGSVGYGARFTATAPCRIATVAVGYADGFLRAAGGVGVATLCADAGEPGGPQPFAPVPFAPVPFAPVPLAIVGRISMDSLALDVTALGDAALPPGTAIDLIGPHRDLDSVARAAGTIGYEILSALGHRYHRRYRGLPPDHAKPDHAA